MVVLDRMFEDGVRLTDLSGDTPGIGKNTVVDMVAGLASGFID